MAVAKLGPDGAPVRSPRRLSRSVRVLLGMSLVFQLPVYGLLAMTLDRAGVYLALAPLVALLALLVLNLPLALRAAQGLIDRPSPTWQIYLLDLPYFTFWSACFGFFFIAPVAALLGLIAGEPPLPVLQATFATTFALATYAVWVRRSRIRTRRISVPVTDLPIPFDGYRIVQLSDIHVGSHVPARRAARWVERANALDADLVVLTGDLISSGSHFLETTARILGRLRAPDGVVLSPGNHDYFCDFERFFAALEREGIELLRNQGRPVERSGATLYLAGADDTWKRLADVDRALAARPPGTPTVLLAHDPRLWREARDLGVELTLSGHTHGGQVAVPFLSKWLNLARTQFEHSNGVYREGRSWLVISNGLGTTGPPARFGVSPEIVEITLRPA